MAETKQGVKRKKYPKCSHYRNGRHRFGINTLSFRECCMLRDKDLDNACKCGFIRAALQDAKQGR